MRTTIQSEILWDTWGVPHIYAKDVDSLQSREVSLRTLGRDPEADRDRETLRRLRAAADAAKPR